MTLSIKGFNMVSLLLEVGKVFLTRQGNKIQITSELEENTQMYKMGYRFVGGPCGQYYTEDGKTYINDPEDNPGDLIKDITDPSDNEWMTKDWFHRHADRRNPKAFILTNPSYFADECASAILNGTLKMVHKDK